MAIDIKKLAKELYQVRFTISLEDYEKTLADIYEQGLDDGANGIILNPLYAKQQRNLATAKTPNPQPHYDNSKGSLYKIAQDRGWDAYQFDIIKRADRCKKKGEFKKDLQKTKDVIDIYLAESDEK